ncbi:MAG: hypothetical protein WD669_11500 [Pirellulales bacterium]
MEFHCTAPVRTSRAQQILFGPTLWPYVLGEQIGGTLVGEAKLRPAIIIADHPAPLCLQSQIEVPMVRLTEAGSRERGAGSGEQNLIVVAGSAFELPPGFDADRDVAIELLTLLAQHVELAEPFERIHEAIREAHRLGERSQDIHEQAA